MVAATRLCPKHVSYPGFAPRAQIAAAPSGLVPNKSFVPVPRSWSPLRGWSHVCIPADLHRRRTLDEYSRSKYAIVMRDVSMVYAIRQETPTGGAERRRTRKTAGPSAIPNRTETAYGSGGDFTRCGSGIQRWSHRALPGSEPQHRRAVRAEVSAFWPAGCLGRVA